MHAHDRTLLSSLGFADPDKRNARHDIACQYVIYKAPEIVSRWLAAKDTCAAVDSPSWSLVCERVQAYNTASAAFKKAREEATTAAEAAHRKADAEHHKAIVRLVDVGFDNNQVREMGVNQPTYAPYISTKTELDEVRHSVDARLAREKNALRRQTHCQFIGFRADGGRTEVVISKGEGKYKTTIGFIDAYFSYSAIYKETSLRLEGEIANRYWYSDNRDSGEYYEFKEEEYTSAILTDVYVEVKITPCGSGDIIRQVKTYREHVSCGDRFVWIAALDFPVDAVFVEALKREHIEVMRLGPDFERFIAETRPSVVTEI